MEKLAEKSSLVGIIVPTMNRPDFVIRQLNYYASLDSPHTLYYADSSGPESAKKIKDEIEKLKNKLNAVYVASPAGDIVKSLVQLLSLVKEKYAVFVSDDDYWIPDALSECVEFLEKNSDYEIATGKSIMFKTENNEVYGKIKEIDDYAKYSVENDTASERLLAYLGEKSSTCITAVLRTDHFLKYNQDSLEIKDFSMRSELLISCLMLIAGKYKVIDKLGYVMQIHDTNSAHSAGDTFDWIIDNENWHSSYNLVRSKAVAALTAKDNISQEKAEQVFKQSMWFYLGTNLRGHYDRSISRGTMNTINPAKQAKKSLRTKIATRLPLLKKVYRQFIVPWLKRNQLQYEVTRPGSKYYKDLQNIVDSLAGKNKTHGKIV